jgi:hypothetical protein
MWIKAEKLAEKTGQVTNQAQKKKHLSPFTCQYNYFLSGSIAPLIVSMLLVCGGLVRRCVVARFV